MNVKKGFFKRGNKGKRGECDWQEAACLGFRFARLRNKDDNEREKKTLRYSRLIGKWRRRRWPEVNKVLVIFYFILTRNGRDVEWSLYFFPALYALGTVEPGKSWFRTQIESDLFTMNTQQSLSNMTIEIFKKKGGAWERNASL